MPISDMNKINAPRPIRGVTPADQQYAPNGNTGTPSKSAAPEYSIQPIAPVAGAGGIERVVAGNPRPKPNQDFNESVARGFTSPGDVNEAAYSSPTPKHKGFFNR